MPRYEQVKIDVNLTIHVDGHVLDFSKTVIAKGCRGVTDDFDNLEKSIRGSIDNGIEHAHRKAMTFVNKAWSDARQSGADVA